MHNMKKKVLITLLVILGALYALGNADIVLNFPNINIQSFENKFSTVHFMAPGNNFVGSIFRLPTKSVPETTITLSWTLHVKKCTKLVRGLYFNSQRGKRIRPLDADTLQLLRNKNTSYNDLYMTWWLYTTCDSGNNYWIFWAITYVRWGITGHVVAGTRLDFNNNKIIAAMANSFQYFDNKVPIGYIYDSNGGIGYVGWRLTGHEDLISYLNSWWSIQSGFTYTWDTIISNDPLRTTIIESWNNAMETMRNLIIEGSVGLSNMDAKERASILGNVQNKTVIYNGNDINSSTVINFAKQKAQELCIGKEPYPNQILWPWPEDIICVEHDLTIPLANTNEYMNKTIIVKSGSVTLQDGMENTFPPLDLFINKWNLYLPDTITAMGFNDNGFPENPGTSSWLYLKWNFVINGLIMGEGTTTFRHKLHLQGKITMLNTPTLPTQGRIDQIMELLWAIYKPYINLQNVFIRTCGLSGTGSDNSSCSGKNIISTIPLVILNGNYPSNLLQ